jgi:putative ABC transport system ATP-binding protein
MRPPSDTPLIRTEQLARRYRMGRETVQALRGVDLEIRRGEYAAITGPSGSGTKAATG